MAMQEIFSQSPREDIFRLVKPIFIFTALAELIGAALLTVFWSWEFGFLEALYLGLFHSVSAFCNAGFCLFSESFIGYRSSVFLNIVICGLIVFGGLGFLVVYEIYEKFLIKKEKRAKISVHTRTVIATTAILIPPGRVCFLVYRRRASGRFP
jgi:trk system potassium uptake protein TrkH